MLEGDITQKELCARMCSDANTIAAMVRLLEVKRLIRRERCDADGRARRVHLTQAGGRLQQKLIARVEPLHGLMDEVLAGRSRELFFECLDRIAEAMADPATPKIVRKPRKRNPRASGQRSRQNI